MKFPIPKKIAVALFYTSKGDILLQDRRKRSKWGEEYGFFGGTVEAGETSEECIERELQEELGLTQVSLELFKEYHHTNYELGVTVHRSVYLSEMPDISKLVCTEGEIAVRKFNNSLDLVMIPGFTELLREIYQSLKSQNKTI